MPDVGTESTDAGEARRRFLGHDAGRRVLGDHQTGVESWIERQERRQVAGAAHIEQPVHPGLPGIGGEGLFPPGMHGVDLGPHVAHPDRCALPCVVALEGADPVVEAADDRHIQLAAAGLGRPPDPPHLLLRAVQPQGDAFQVTLRRAEHVEDPLPSSSTWQSRVAWSSYHSS
jgi:hypothetical protein